MKRIVAMSFPFVKMYTDKDAAGLAAIEDLIVFIDELFGENYGTSTGLHQISPCQFKQLDDHDFNVLCKCKDNEGHVVELLSGILLNSDEQTWCVYSDVYDDSDAKYQSYYDYLYAAGLK